MIHLIKTVHQWNTVKLLNSQHRMLAVDLPQPSAENVVFLPLYTSHFLQTFGDRLWQFALPILFTEIFTDSIMPQAIFAFGIYSAVFVAMPAFGSWIDTTNRSRVVTLTIVIQNICVILSSVALYCISLLYPQNPAIDYTFILLFAACLVPSMLGQIMGMGATLALEKDWVVVLCQNNTTLLTTINGRMRRIDLFCKLMAPALFGVVTQYLGHNSDQKIQYGAIWIVAWNVIGLFLEYYTIRIVYNANPILSTSMLKVNQGKAPKKINNCTKIIGGWKFYIRSQMLYASVAYCMLYCSVLDSGSLVAAYLRTDGISYSVLGITKGIGALFGITGTLLTPCLRNSCGIKLEWIGVFTIWLFWLSLAPSGVQFVAEKAFDKDIFTSSVSVDDSYVILFCMVIARCGLWAFDLAENQLMQERVFSNVRAQVNGVQVSVSQLFFIFVAVLAMVFSDTSQFYILVFITLGVVFAACVLYTLWCCCSCCRREGNDDPSHDSYDKLSPSN
eukprot:237348_1